MECSFCNIINGEAPTFKVWEDHDFLVILDIKPINPGHLLLIPKQHFADVFALPDPLYHSLFQTARKMVPVLKEVTSAKRIGLAIEGFSVPHVHLHLVPVNNGNELNPERAKRVSQDELKEMWNKLAKFFRISKLNLSLALETNGDNFSSGTLNLVE